MPQMHHLPLIRFRAFLSLLTAGWLHFTMRIRNTDGDKLQIRNLHLWIRYHLPKATRGRRSFDMHSRASGAADLHIAQLLIVALLFGFSMAPS